MRISKFVVAVMAVCCLTAGPCTERSGFDPDEPVVASISFTPVDGTWDIRFVNRPSNSIQFADTERYRVTLTGTNSPRAQSRRLQIMAGSTQIGNMEVNFPAGTAAPTFNYRPNEGANVTPAGAVNLTGGEFWLGCTSPNRYVRGNKGHATSTSSNVSVRLAWQHNVTTPAQAIRCQ
jgi:hypothetical protein